MIGAAIDAVRPAFEAKDIQFETVMDSQACIVPGDANRLQQIFLLVSDIGMPKEDGYSLIQRLRKMRSKRGKEIPAVALTDYATVEDRARALDAGFHVHVAKPIDPEALVRTIAGAAGRRG